MNFLKALFPRPPSFRRARKVEKDLSGCILSFEVPPYSDPFSANKEWETEPDSIDIYDEDAYHLIKYHSAINFDELIEYSNIEVRSVFSSIWTVKSTPIISIYGGDIQLGIGIATINDLPINETLFNNKTLLHEVFRRFDLTRLQNFNKGIKSDFFDLTQYRWPSYLGPLNSQWVEQGGLDWLYFETQPLVSDSDSISWHTAISDKHILSCYFTITRSVSNAGNAFRINQRMPWDNYINFSQKIMDSLKLGLSPELNARRTEVQSQLGANSKPIFGCSPQQVEDAKYVMRMWSDTGYMEAGKSRDADLRATPEEVSEFIDKRIQPRPLHNSYPLEEKIEVVSRLPPELIQRPLIGPR
ncbi:hypothetical protein ACJJID_01780 [Microbulbifer sp. CnH-101-G]|uniref:hypothetical protein n=1 Tax=Microbulbifer sp. CnH-101-G TaxID=3243393 RepID=UPI004039BB57